MVYETFVQCPNVPVGVTLLFSVICNDFNDLRIHWEMYSNSVIIGPGSYGFQSDQNGLS